MKIVFYNVSRHDQGRQKDSTDGRSRNFSAKCLQMHV